MVGLVSCVRDLRQKEFSGEEWKEEELSSIYGTHERLMEMALLFCFVPRAKYLPLGPVRLGFRV